MKEKDKDQELKEALEKLEKCCPGSTRVSHMKTASTELHKALLNLDHARIKEQRLREESDALLEGINIIKDSESMPEAFNKVLNILKRLVKFDDAFVLRENNDKSLSAVAASSQLFEDIVWHPGSMLKQVLAGTSTNIRNINYSADWQKQPPDIRRNVVSALHLPLSSAMENAMLICTSSQENYFNKIHMQQLERFTPLVGQALYNFKINELLDDEIKKRKQAEERLKEVLK